jgi:cell division protease FtsH
MTIFRPQEDKSFRSRSEMFEQIVMALGGRISEKLFLDDISTGASGDITQASAIARSMVTTYGMSDRLGPISFDSSAHSFIGPDFSQTKSYTAATPAIIDEEVKRIFDEASSVCERILTEHGDLLRDVAEYLLAHETMDGDDFNYFCEHRSLPPRQEKPEEIPENSGDGAREAPGREKSAGDGDEQL